MIHILILIVGTGILLFAVTYLYSLFDKAENASLRFGVIGTIMGLILDTFALSNHHYIFPQLRESQIIAFTTWMSFAYALYLIIPFIINELKKRRRMVV
ncbi:DUF5367 family protein [Cytobacillus dafuensis]|uniref:DUF5367 family protein n=1 Tax=Cytobacillus dafuensis TaxID=1742359 RepID=UPI000B334969|nr:DUF5367 family protein [Cytobacillus dafuensis]